MFKIFNLILIFSAIGIWGCNNKPTNPEKPTVSVSILPQKYFVNQIAGDFLNVNVMVPPGASPATYEPTPQQMKDLSQSLIYFRIGHIGFEKAWMNKLASINSTMKIIDTSEGLPLIYDDEFGVVHHDDHGHSHTHDGYNPHIWLSPKLVKGQANKILHSLIELYPDQKSNMKKKYTAFANKCDSLQNALSLELAPYKGTTFIVYHPVWSYPAKDFHLNQIAIEHSGKEATAKKLKYIIDFAKSKDIKTIFVQKEFNDAQATTIANEINGKVVPLNPLDYNWENVMNEFVKAFN